MEPEWRPGGPVMGGARDSPSSGPCRAAPRALTTLADRESTDIASRPDVVKFTSAPLQQDLTIAGDVMLVLYASTDVRDIDWWVHNDAFPNSNTGQNEATVTETVVGKMALHHSAGQASHIILPVMSVVK